MPTNICISTELFRRCYLERVDIKAAILAGRDIAGLGVAGMLVDRRVHPYGNEHRHLLAAVLLGRIAPMVYLRGRIVGRGFRRFRHSHADGIVTSFRPRGRRGTVHVYHGLEYRRRRWRDRRHAARQGRGGLFAWPLSGSSSCL
ncbi:hypothetical protein M8494_17170 [Serratia ureilytica]